MEATLTQHAALAQLAAIPGVIGSMVFDAGGAVLTSAFPPTIEPAALARLAGQLSADGYFQEWVAGETANLELRYAGGSVVVRSLEGAWLLVLCAPQSNAQLLAMSLNQVVRRLKLPVEPPPSLRGPAPAAGPPPPASAVERLRLLVSRELGAQAEQALELIAAAGPRPKDLARAAEDVEKMVRLFISKKKAEEIGARMRELLGS